MKTEKLVALETIELQNEISLSYQHFGQCFTQAPVIMINHPLTGDSNVAGETGWWNCVIGDGKVIDTQKYAVIAFNIPGNGYGGRSANLVEPLSASDVAQLFYEGLQALGIQKLYALIGGSIGAGIAWEMAAKFPDFIQKLIPVSGDWKATDWMLANVYLQKKILETHPEPLEIARMHAMLCYRTPQSFKLRFDRSWNTDRNMFNVESWLSYHGEKLAQRFSLQAYKNMNHILGTIDITQGRNTLEDVLRSISSEIHILSIDSDLFFPIDEDRETVKRAHAVGKTIHHHVIHSDFGHDAFLMEHDKVITLFEKIID